MHLIRHHFITIDSTNTWAKQHIQEFDPKALTLISADTQTAGRGRFKRAWCSPNGNIYATFCCCVDPLRSDIGHLTQLLALAAAQVIESLGLKPALKWPNDVLLGGKKIAGILCETLVEQNLRYVICGIGLNVNMPVQELEKIGQPATSLFAETGQILNVEDILLSISTYFSDCLTVFLKEGFSSFLPAYKQRFAFKAGQIVRFHDNQHMIEARFHTFNTDGSITLQLCDGQLKNYYAGEFLLTKRVSENL
jgi:BirA family biotin operon repressor/biotin-[acetyl-CoA-carboxylase] ligase